MRAAFDHLVHFIDRPPAKATELFRQAGFHAVAGGRHEAWGTWNSLSYFGLSYIEFLAIKDETVAKQSDNPLIRQLVRDRDLGEGLGQIALRTSQMDEWVQRLRTNDLVVHDPVAGSRKRDDGTTLSWRMLFFEDANSKLRPPFFIEWQQSEEEREQDLTEREIIAPHPNGAQNLQQTGYAVADLEEAASSWLRWFGFQSTDVFVDEQLGALCQTLIVPGGNIVLCQPNQQGLAQQALAARGERPFFVRLAGEGIERLDIVFGSIYLRS
ncbi:VOC family protein [Brevibacillus sp. NRS-1366]|uniref:VOC family protein n=1 Tax=Brevibacillus sp. NRS-1366 TaxID=3233899 RepID=UPI003D249A08